jgi:Chemotaxis protein histidine kinase and related kinases
MPGFSTSTGVTKVSGRGVGMDVVKSVMESFNGTVSVETEKDKGTKVLLKLPFTIIITKVFLVKAHENTYAVPLASVKRIIDLRSVNIKTIDREEVLLLADKTVPLLSLGEILFGNRSDPRYGLLIEEEASGVVLGVDSVLGIEDIVAKPLSRTLKSTPYFSGSTLLGDGTAILIIDPKAFLKISKQLSERS